MNLLDYFLVFISLVLITIIILNWLKWKYRKIPFTRERYAFFGLSIILTLSVYIIPYLFGNNLLIQFINFLSVELFDTSVKVNSPDISDRILAFLFVAFIGYVYVKIFVNWNGKKSLRQYELDKHRITTTVIKEVKNYLIEKEKLREYIPELDSKINFNLIEPEIESIVWHEQVYDLLTLSTSQYKIDKENDWYEKERCYVSSYGKLNIPTGVYCSFDFPSNKKVIDFIEFIKKQIIKKNEPSEIKFLIAIKNKTEIDISKVVNDCEIQFISEDILLNQLIDFSNYETYINDLFEKKEIIAGYKLTLKDVYTDPSCMIRDRELDTSIKINNIENYITEWANQDKNRKQLAILGEYGQGKSVLSLRIAYSIINENLHINRIPIIIELRGRYPKQYPNTLALLSDWCSNFSINPKALLKLHYAGRLIIIFEGFDEMELVGDYEIRIDHFRKLWSFSTPKSKIIITGRPNFFLNENELKTLLLTSSQYQNLTYCEEIYLQRFSITQIKDALRNVSDDTREEIFDVLEEQHLDSSFYDLLSRPSSLFLTSIVWKERNISKFKTNINSALVIEEFLKHSYSRQEIKGNKSALSIHERAYFMKGIAVGMANKNGYTNQINQAELKELILKLYEDFPEEITNQNINSKDYNKKLQQRFDNKYNKETVLLDIRSCGVLVRDLATFDSFKFAHKSFFELLVSNYISNSLINLDVFNNQLDTIINNSISMAIGCSPNQLMRTPDVLKFIAEQSARLIKFKDSKSDVEKVRYIFEKTYPYRFLRMETVFKLIPVLGKDIRFGMIMMSYILGSSFFVAFMISKWVFGVIINHIESEKSCLLIVIALSILISFLLIRSSHNVLIKHSSISEMIQIIVNSKKINFEIYVNKVLKSKYNTVTKDVGNLFLFYLICKELDLLESLEKNIPIKQFNEFYETNHLFYESKSLTED